MRWRAGDMGCHGPFASYPHGRLWRGVALGGAGTQGRYGVPKAVDEGVGRCAIWHRVVGHCHHIV